ncbi:MAG: hypothetical protein ISP86_03210, partial [Shewanellaceae bacterium]|nr:hypothetical protein [Shewanellaceae bacterium]
FIFMEKACDNSTVKDHLQCLKKLTRQKNYFKRAYEGFKKDGSDSKSESDALSYINIAIEDIQTIKQSLKNSGEIWLNDYIANNVVRDAEVDYEAIYYSLIEEDYSTDAEQYALLKQAEHALAMLIQAGSEDELSYQKLQEKKAEMAEDLYQELIGSALRLEDAYPMTATCDLIAGVSPAIKAERSRLAQDMKSLIDQLNKAPAILTNQDFRYRRYELVKGYKALANQDDCYAFYNLSLIQQFLGNAKSTPTNIQKDPRFAFAFARVAAQAGLAEASWLMSNHAYSMLRDDMSAENKTHTLERAIRWLNRAEKQMDPNNDADKARLLEWKNKLNGMLQQISENVSH